ncbi:cysteine desulfurase family protein [Bacillus gobiensis]|uniref:cysteine desulfurase family protein n=1 Tax=Bacillus gobiensis TaxID=1441095 RepID=UPI003D1D8240
MLYLDNSATTIPYEEVIDVYGQVSRKFFGNPSSLHAMGTESERLLQTARDQIIEILQIQDYNVFFTSGGTEGNNLAIKGLAFSRMKKGKHIISTAIEHPSVMEPLEQLRDDFGFDVTFLPVNHEGRISVSELENAMRDDTILVSIMHVNNETGAIQPIEAAGKVIKGYPNACFHVDYVQGVSKVPLSFDKANIDLSTISGHKFHGLKGTGALLVKKGVKLYPLLSGGGQEEGLRSGTQNVAGAVSLAKALRLSYQNFAGNDQSMKEAKGLFLKELSAIPGVELNTLLEKSAPHIINFSVPGVKAEVLLHMLEDKNIYVSTTSACSSGLHKPSRVLLAMGKTEKEASGSIRISMSFGQTKEMVPEVITTLKEAVGHLRELTR